MANQTFQFSVDSNGKFTYTPADKWKYFHDSVIQFESTSGPFAVRLRQTDTSPASAMKMDPFGGNVPAQLNGNGQWVATVNAVKDGLSPAERSQIFKNNIPSGGTVDDGFIGQYNYLVAAIVDGKVLIDDTQDGCYVC
jgi:hypothetical protein